MNLHVVLVIGSDSQSIGMSAMRVTIFALAEEHNPLCKGMTLYLHPVCSQLGLAALQKPVQKPTALASSPESSESAQPLLAGAASCEHARMQ